MSNAFDYKQTPALNNDAPPDGAPEGQAPSSLNNCMRQMMANTAGSFACYTGGGTANAHTITMSPTLDAYSNKVKIAYIPPANNTGAYTVNVNTLGNVSVKMQDGTDPPADAANSLGVSVIQHNGTNFTLLNPAGLVGLGVTATAAELNKTDDSAAAISGYVSGMRTYLHEDGANSTTFDVDAVFGESSFESIGPTDSGATNEWPAMDGIPNGAIAVILKASLVMTINVTTGSFLGLYGRRTGSSSGLDLSTILCGFSHEAASGDIVEVEHSTLIVPLDASRRLDLGWFDSGTSGRSVRIAVQGFIV